jgi:predicted acyl esterase
VSAANEDEMTVVNVSARGIGPSEGLYDGLGPRGAEDIRDVIAWARSQPWSNGRVVLIGASGGAQFIMHGLHEPGVTAAVVIFGCLDLYPCAYRDAGVFSPLLSPGFIQLIQQRQRSGAATRSVQNVIADVRVPIFHTSSNFDVVQSWAAAQRAPDGRSAWITEGQLRASLRQVERYRSLRGDRRHVVKAWHDLSRARPVRPGRTRRYEVPLYEASNVFQAGHRIRRHRSRRASGRRHGDVAAQALATVVGRAAGHPGAVPDVGAVGPRRSRAVVRDELRAGRRRRLTSYVHRRRR